jgi:acyl-coenzyme A thioesterase PaaI-like protein
MGTNPMTAAMVLADFRLTDARTQPKSLLCSKIDALAAYAANYHNSYEKLSAVLSTRTQRLRALEQDDVAVQAQLERLRISLAHQQRMLTVTLEWLDAFDPVFRPAHVAELRAALAALESPTHAEGETR